MEGGAVCLGKNSQGLSVPLRVSLLRVEGPFRWVRPQNCLSRGKEAECLSPKSHLPLPQGLFSNSLPGASGAWSTG